MSRALVAVALTAALVFHGSGIANAATAPTPLDDPYRLGWPAFSPVVPRDGVASTETTCVRGSVACVDNVIAEMTRRLTPLGCTHDAVFSLVYLRTTQEYRRAVENPAFFADNAFVNHEDAVFADLYFQAHDRFRAGRLAEVPPVWRISFHAAATKKVTSIGNMLMGMNAHINRDLPFVLNAIGLRDATGASRKPDHDRVNDILAIVNRYALYEVSLRYDPTAGDGLTPATTMDYHALQNLVTKWREQAWSNARRLDAAATPAQKLQVASSIESQAAATAQSLAYTYAYRRTDDPAARDTYCAAHLAS